MRKVSNNNRREILSFEEKAISNPILNRVQGGVTPGVMWVNYPK